MWLTSELFQFRPVMAGVTGQVQGYHLHVGTDKFPVGIIPYVAHRQHAGPSSIHIAAEGGRWWLSLAADDPDVAIPGRDADAATERIAEDWQHLSAEQLAERTLGGDRGIAKPLATSDGQIFDLQPVQKARIQKARRQRKRWQRKAARRRRDLGTKKKAYRKIARSYQYEANVRDEYAHQTSHNLVTHAAYDLLVFEDLPIRQMTKRPKAKRDAHGRFWPNGRKAKAGLHRAILTSAWGEVVSFTRYKALRQGKVVITVSPQHSSQACAVCTFTSPDNRRSQAAFVCQRCGHTDNADHHAAVVIAKRGIQKLLSGEPLTKPHKRTRIFRPRGPERSKVTPGETTSDMRSRWLARTSRRTRNVSE